MDGGIRFFSYNKGEDWENGCYSNLEIDHQGVKLPQTNKYSNEKQIYIDRISNITTVYDFAIGENGRIFLLDERANIYAYDFENDLSEQLTKNKHHLFSKHVTMVSTGDLIFLADCSDNPSVLSYSISNGQVVWKRTTIDDEPFFPLTITTNYGKSIYILIPLEVEIGKDKKHYVMKNSEFAIVKMSLSGEILSVIRNEQFFINSKERITSLRKRFSLAVSSEDKICLFDTKTNQIVFVTANGEIEKIKPLQNDSSYSTIALDSDHHLFIGNNGHIVSEGEDNRFISKYSSKGVFLGQVPGYRGKVDQIHIDRNNRIFVWNSELQIVSILTLKKKTKEMSETGLLKGVFISKGLDTTEEEIDWHKIALYGDIPDETQIRISYFVSDSKRIQINDDFIDLDRYIEDDSISFKDKLTSLREIWSEPIINPKDSLLNEAKGRYLWFKLELFGSEQKTPLINKIRFYFPRSSLLEYLPAVYQDDNKSKYFLERFLSLFQTFIDDLDEKILNVTKFLDVDTVSGEYLEWIACWLGIKPREQWNETQLRELVKNAPELYKRRGTKWAIAKMIEIFTGSAPFILEHFQLKDIRKNLELKQLSDELYDSNPYCFFVLVHAESVEMNKNRLVIEKILDEEKPAFTEAKLITLEPWVYLNLHSYLGVNTFLSELSLLNLNNKTSIPSDTVLIDVDRKNRIDVHTRLGLDSELE